MDIRESSVLNFIPQKNDVVLAYRVFDGQAVIVDLVYGTLNTLNTTATRIWQLIGGVKSTKEIANKLTEEFDVSYREAIKDVVDALKNMAAMGWIEDFSSSEKQQLADQDKKTELFEAIREQATENKIPLVVHFDLTYRCPLRCEHCYLVSGKKYFEYTTDEVKNVLNQLADAGTLYLTFSGGEIFLRDDLHEIVVYARKLHFAVRLLTSGVLINEEVVNEIASWHPELVAFSIYDLDATIHDAITKKRGSLMKTLYALKALKDKGVPLKISLVLMKRNVDHYRKVYNFAKGLGAQFQADYRITPKTDGSKKPLKFHISDQDVKGVLSDPIFSRENKQESPEGYSGIFNTIPCGAGHMSCYISPYGMVTPCVQVPIDCGTLKEKTFSDIWNNSLELKTFRKITFADMPRCAICESFAYCRPCPGLNLVESGNIAAPPQRICKEAEYMRTLNRKRR